LTFTLSGQNYAAKDCAEAKMVPFRNKRKLLILQSGLKYFATARSIPSRIGLSRWKSLAPYPVYVDFFGEWKPGVSTGFPTKPISKTFGEVTTIAASTVLNKLQRGKRKSPRHTGICV